MEAIGDSQPRPQRGFLTRDYIRFDNSLLAEAFVMSCTAQDALGERLLGAIWIVSGLIVLALTIATALQNGDYEHLNPQPALS